MVQAVVQKTRRGVRITGVGFAYPAGPNAGKLAIGGIDLWEFVRDYFHLHYINPAYLGEVDISITIIEPPGVPR